MMIMTVELAFNPDEARDPEGRWVDVHMAIEDVERLTTSYAYDRLNPEADDIQELARVIKRNGFPGHITVEETNRDPFVSDGNHRLLAAKVAGLKTVPVRRFSNTEAGRSAARKAACNTVTLDGSHVTR